MSEMEGQLRQIYDISHVTEDQNQRICDYLLNRLQQLMEWRSQLQRGAEGAGAGGSNTANSSNQERVSSWIDQHHHQSGNTERYSSTADSTACNVSHPVPPTGPPRATSTPLPPPGCPQPNPADFDVPRRHHTGNTESYSSPADSMTVNSSYTVPPTVANSTPTQPPGCPQPNPAHLDVPGRHHAGNTESYSTPADSMTGNVSHPVPPTGRPLATSTPIPPPGYHQPIPTPNRQGSAPPRGASTGTNTYYGICTPAPTRRQQPATMSVENETRQLTHTGAGNNFLPPPAGHFRQPTGVGAGNGAGNYVPPPPGGHPRHPAGVGTGAGSGNLPPATTTGFQVMDCPACDERLGLLFEIFHLPRPH